MSELAATINKTNNKRAASPPPDDKKAKKSKKEKKTAPDGDADMTVSIPVPSKMIFCRGTYSDSKDKLVSSGYLTTLSSHPGCEQVALVHSLDINKSIGSQEVAGIEKHLSRIDNSLLSRVIDPQGVYWVGLAPQQGFSTDFVQKKLQASPDLVLVQGLWPAPLTREGSFATWAWLLDSPAGMTQEKADLILRNWKEGATVMYQILRQFTTTWMVRADRNTLMNEWMTQDSAMIKVGDEELSLKRVKTDRIDIQMCLLCLGGPVARSMHPQSKCKRLVALNNKRKEENMQPISITEDGEISWINQPPTLDVQESLRTLMTLVGKVASLEAEVKALKEAKVTTNPTYAETTKGKDKPKVDKPKAEEQKDEGSDSRGKKSGRGRGSGRGGRRGGVPT
ncbi:hypothetical protein EDB19DRAFT_1830870 [Suillus lakei]|nr:hypothetical protein EDB19DRAFT_1830870 [Suillus lakei]